MAELFLAKATGIEGFEKLVVLKRILPQHAASEDFVAMFLAEARLAATLHHPNIAQTYDIGEAGGSYFFTMEYVHGEDVRALQKALEKAGRPLPYESAIAIVLGVAAGLHHAHEKHGPDGRPLGLVHRDVSPSNVLIGHDGSVKLVDFGIAKATALKIDTRAGTLKGKISYMSPEQCRGEPLDRRSDLYALGILLWELTTGKRLYQGENEFAILTQIVSRDVPSPTEVVPGYPEPLARIVMAALRRDREQRYPTALALQVELEELARHERLNVTSTGLSRLMEETFGRRPDPFLAAGPSISDEKSQRSLVAAESRALTRPRRWIAPIAGSSIILGAAAVVVIAGARNEPRPPAPTQAVVAPAPAPAPVPVAAPPPDASVPDAARAPAPSPSPSPEPVPAPPRRQRPVPARAPSRPVEPPPKLEPAPAPTTPPPAPEPKWDPDSPLPPPRR